MKFKEWCQGKNITGKFLEALIHQIVSDHDGDFLSLDFDALTENDYLEAWRKVLDYALTSARASTSNGKVD